MVNLDLRALSAPIEALRPDVEDAYDALEAQWGEIREALQKLLIPCTVGYTYWQLSDNPTHSRLEWRKWKGKKQICDAEYRFYTSGPVSEEEIVIPFDEWSGETRLKMLRHVPGLFKAAAEQTQEFINSIK